MSKSTILVHRVLLCGSSLALGRAGASRQCPISTVRLSGSGLSLVFGALRCCCCCVFAEPRTWRLLTLPRVGSKHKYSVATAVSQLEAKAAYAPPVQLRVGFTAGSVPSLFCGPRMADPRSGRASSSRSRLQSTFRSRSGRVHRASQLSPEDYDGGETSSSSQQPGSSSTEKEQSDATLQSKGLYMTVEELLQEAGGIDQVLANGRTSDSRLAAIGDALEEEINVD